MEIFGHEYGLLYSVGAMEDVRKICPDQDLNRLGEVPRLEGGMKLIIILSKWHEKAEAFMANMEGREYVQQPITEELLSYVPVDKLPELISEALHVMGAQKAPSVETEEPKNGKKKEERPAQKSS